MPFGGTGLSGLGHYYGKHGFDMLTHAKSILISPPDVAIDHLFPPATNEKIATFNSVWYDYDL
jgi:aldehyde dehydrogenase (NAD+)